MIAFVVLVAVLSAANAQRPASKGIRYNPIPYYNFDSRAGSGLGLLQDLSHAKILSNEPFIISFEFPKIVGSGGGSGDSRKSLLGAKRSKSQRKRNRKLRQFRHIVLPEGDQLERRKRFQITYLPSNYQNIRTASLVKGDGNHGLKIQDGTTQSTGVSDLERFPKYKVNENNPANVESSNEFQVKEVFVPRKSLLDNLLNATKKNLALPEAAEKVTIPSGRQKNWEKNKDLWDFSLSNPKVETENEVEHDEDDLTMAKTKKMWANCQLLKLLKIPQKNPYFYKLLPPNYPAQIMSEEKQYRCKDMYDYADLARDKKMVLDKIEQLEKILSADFGSKIWKSGFNQKQMEAELKSRRKRSVEKVEAEVKSEKKNTILDESLQGKSEGEIRSDRSKRTKAQPKNLQIARPREIGNEHKGAKSHNRGKLKKKKPQRNLTPKAGRRKGNALNMHEKKDDEDKLNVEPEVERSRRHNVHYDKEDMEIRNEIEKENSEENGVKFKADKNDAASKTDKQEKKDIKKAKEVLFQDVFVPSEVNKIVKQKEVEANIFDKVVRAMKKYEEDPMERPAGQQKRESKNEAEAMMENFQNKLNATGQNDSWELEDTIKKLARIFKMLGVANEAKKKKICDGCEETEENESTESEEKSDVVKAKKSVEKVKKSKASKPCTCPVKEDDCPICHNCVKCFRECRKSHGVASKSQAGVDSGDLGSRDSQEHIGLNNEEVETSENKMNNLSKGSELLAKALMQSGGRGGDTPYRHNDLKTERMYRSKLPPTRDLVRVYFDNPENKLLVWTKRGRRTMPWGPLTTDLQLYRDRAKQILKSAEDILERIKETEKKIHSPESYDENKSEGLAAGNNRESDVEDIIKKIVNEGDAKDILTAAWTKVNEKGNETVAEKMNQTAEHEEKIFSRLLSGDSEEQVDSGEASYADVFDEKNNYEDLKEITRAGYTSPQADSNIDDVRLLSENDEEGKDVDGATNESHDFKDGKTNKKEKIEYTEQIYADNAESRSVEAAVEPIEGKMIEIEGQEEKQIEYNTNETQKDTSRQSDEVESAQLLMEDNTAEEKDIPARVEAVQKEKEAEENKNAFLASTEDDYYFKYEEALNDREEDLEDNEEVSSSREDIHEPKLEAMKRVNDEKSNESSSRATNSEENIFVEKEELVEEENEEREKNANEKKLSSVAPQSGKNIAELVVSEEDASNKRAWSENVAGSYEDLEVGNQSKDEGETLEYVQSSEHEKEPKAKLESTEESYKIKEITSEEMNRLNDNEKTLEEEDQEEKNNEEKIFEDQIKPMEENYQAKGKAQQTIKEKEAMLSALMNVEKINDREETEKTSPPKEKEEEEDRGDQVSRILSGKLQEEEGTEAPEKEAVVEGGNPERNSFKTFIDHVVRGHMEAKDFEVVKSLEESKIDSLIEELKENDKKNLTTNCGTKLKLCQAACGCDRNGTSTELSKYDIIRGFLSWLKKVQLDRMVPISI